MMMEALNVIKNPNATSDEKELAWEDFEMLIQQIDNAAGKSEHVPSMPEEFLTIIKRFIFSHIASSLLLLIDIENMKMWPPILEELKNTNPKFREQAAWVCGTATQNNPKAQSAVCFLPPFDPLVSCSDALYTSFC